MMIRQETDEETQETTDITRFQYIVLLDNNNDSWFNTVNAAQFHFNKIPGKPGILNDGEKKLCLACPSEAQVKYYLSTYMYEIIRRTPNLDYLAPMIEASIESDGSIKVIIKSPKLGHISSEAYSENVVPYSFSFSIIEETEDDIVEYYWRNPGKSSDDPFSSSPFYLSSEFYGKTLMAVTLFERPLYFDKLLDKDYKDITDQRASNFYPRSYHTLFTLPTPTDSRIYSIRRGNALYFNPLDTIENLQLLTFTGVNLEFLQELYQKEFSTFIVINNGTNNKVLDTFTFNRCIIDCSGSGKITFEWMVDFNKRVLSIEVGETNTVTFSETNPLQLNIV